MKCEIKSFDIVHHGIYPKNLYHVLPQNKFAYFTIFYYVLNTKWCIVSQINHFTTTTNKYYTTKLTPIAVGDRKIVPKKLLEIFFKKKPNKRFNEICKECINK